MRIAPLLLCLCACADGVTVLRYQPSPTTNTARTIDHGRTTLPRPARGTAAIGVLADGFPVWIVHHQDGTVSVISAVAPARPRIQPVTRDHIATQVDQNLVGWIAGVRRFYASGILFDEHGTVLGYADFDGCLDECVRIDAMPLVLRDLDTFTITGSESIEVGALVAGQTRRRASTFLPWRRASNREEDMRDAEAPTLPRRSLVDALALVDKQFAIVDGEAVRSTHAEPSICQPSNKPGTCGECGTERLPLAGIASSDAAHIHSGTWWHDPLEYRRDLHAVYVEAEPGTFLVQRQGAGFRLVAGIFRGMCSGSW